MVLGIMQTADLRILALGWREGFAIRKSEFGSRNEKTKGLWAAGRGVLQRGCLHNGDYATRAVKLGFRKIGPPNGETGLQMGNSEWGIRTRKHGEAARGRNE